jgi:hypothetical protein
MCLRKFFKMLIKEKSGLEEHANAAEKLIPSTFEEEANLLDTDSIATLKIHYMAYLADKERFLKLLRRLYITSLFNWIYN